MRRAAAWATSRLIAQIALLVEFLFAGAEDEILPTFSTPQSLVLKHGRTSPCEGPHNDAPRLHNPSHVPWARDCGAIIGQRICELERHFCGMAHTLRQSHKFCSDRASLARRYYWL
jgi:hypothetical protein